MRGSIRFSALDDPWDPAALNEPTDVRASPVVIRLLLSFPSI